MALVDNHRILTDLMTKFLNSQPRTNVLFTAENGLDMQSKLDSDNLPDVMVLDVRMPEMDGYLTAGWLREFYPSVRILILTALQDEDLVTHLQLLDVNGFLYKTDGHEEAYRAITEVMDKGYYQHEAVKRPSQFDVQRERERVFLQKLYTRRYELYPLLCTDMSKGQIAKCMDVSYASVKRYTETLFEQYGVSSRPALVSKLYELGLVPPQ